MTTSGYMVSMTQSFSSFAFSRCRMVYISQPLASGGFQVLDSGPPRRQPHQFLYCHGPKGSSWRAAVGTIRQTANFRFLPGCGVSLLLSECATFTLRAGLVPGIWVSYGNSSCIGPRRKATHSGALDVTPGARCSGAQVRRPLDSRRSQIPLLCDSPLPETVLPWVGSCKR